MQLNFDVIVAKAPKRSPTPETPSIWPDNKHPGSRIMSPVTSTDGLTRLDLDRGPYVAGLHISRVGELANEPGVLASSSLGDLSGTLDRRSGLTEPAQQSVNTPEAPPQHLSQKPMPFTRFIENEETAAASFSLDALNHSTHQSSFSLYPNSEPLRVDQHPPSALRDPSVTPHPFAIDRQPPSFLYNPPAAQRSLDTYRSLFQHPFSQQR